MKKDNEYIKFLFIGFCAFLVICFLRFFIPPRISEGINDLISWYVYSFSQKPASSFKLVAVAVDEYSLNMIPQRQPWKRPVYAQAIEVLNREKADTIGFDVIFTGASEDKEDDRIFQKALRDASSRIVLAYLFDVKKRSPVFPLPEFKDAAYSLGMLNTPVDSDNKVRRLRGYITDLEGRFHYSFSVALAAAFLRQSPKDIVSSLPLFPDRTYPVNYFLKPKDIITISFCDIFTDNLKGYKKRYGNDFLQGSLVLIYPQAEIFHDTHNTPFGRIPGGALHLNGAANIISGRLAKQLNFLVYPLLIFSFAAVYYILRYFGFITGSLLVLGVLIFEFWASVILSLGGVRFNYSQPFIFAILFFILGSLYKYVSFWAQISKIKDKATFDPLKSIFTLRYFYYRFGLELKKIYFGRNLFLVFIYLGPGEIFEDMPLEKTKALWQEISAALFQKGNLWSVYSRDEVAGCVISPAPKINAQVNFLKNSLEKLLAKSLNELPRSKLRGINFFTNRNAASCGELTPRPASGGIKPKLKIAYLKFKKNYPLRELLFALSSELKKRGDDTALFKDGDLAGLLDLSVSKTKEASGLLHSLDEDIEDKNRQLLSLIENLNQEHAKTKEAFFQIITSLVNALEARDHYTEGHSIRVSNYALILAEKLGWPMEEKEKLRKAALLHDLGKIGIPDAILHKKGSLNAEEYNFIKKHEIIGVKILEPLKEISEILPWILYHHERWDGKGYPHGLAADAIPRAAQIISLADVFDALTTGRDYKPAFSFDEAIREISKNKGTQFNPQLADLFIDIVHSKNAA